MRAPFQRADFGLVCFAGTAAIAMVLANTGLAHGQVSYIGTPYTQTFDSLIKTGSVAFAQDTATNPTLPGWYALRSGTSDLIVASNGSSGTGGLYSFGYVAPMENFGDRALGSIGSNTPMNLVWAVRIRNDTGQNITGFTVGYTGEQWRYSGLMNFAANPQTLKFSYAIFRDVDAPPATQLLNTTATSGFTSMDTMDFTSPIISGTVGGLNGNDAANRVIFSTTINVPIPAGQDLWVRWNDINHDGNDHGMATDDFFFDATSYQPVPAPPALVSLGIGGLVFLAGTRLRRPRSRNRRTGTEDRTV